MCGLFFIPLVVWSILLYMFSSLFFKVLKLMVVFYSHIVNDINKITTTTLENKPVFWLQRFAIRMPTCQPIDHVVCFLLIIPNFVAQTFWFFFFFYFLLSWDNKKVELHRRLIVILFLILLVDRRSLVQSLKFNPSILKLQVWSGGHTLYVNNVQN